MQRSLALAAKAVGVANPNPAVGCVIVDAHGQVLGEGHTQPVGGPHAEVMALRDAQARGHGVRGATAYVTLEPCAHFGHTPPCCDALAAAGIGKVVAALTDPNPKVAGQGFARLRAAGITVEVGDGEMAARDLNLGFLKRMETGQPWVRAKVAASLDGHTALLDGQSQWITGEAARTDGQRWRLRADVVLTGIGTVLADDPLLNVRLPDCVRQPHLAIVDSLLRTPPDARLWQVARRQVLIAHQSEAGLDAQNAQALAARKRALQALGARLLPIAPCAHGLDLAQVLQALLEALPGAVNEVHVEAGAALNGGLLAQGLVDEWLVYLAPKMLGGGRPMAQRISPLRALADANAGIWLAQYRVGDDLCLRVASKASV